MQGQLFSQDFLARGILQTPPYQQLDEPVFQAFQARLQAIYASTPEGAGPAPELVHP